MSEAIAAERLDHHAITLTMKMHTFDGSVGSIVALQDQHNGRFLAASLNTVQGLPGSSSVKSFRSLRRVSLLTTRAHMPAQVCEHIFFFCKTSPQSPASMTGQRGPSYDGVTLIPRTKCEVSEGQLLGIDQKYAKVH